MNRVTRLRSSFFGFAEFGDYGEVFESGRVALDFAMGGKFAKQAALVPKLRSSIMLPGCGHWTQQERASEVSTAMIDFLRSL